MKLKFIDGGFNLNYVKIYKKGTKAPIAKSDDLTKGYGDAKTWTNVKEMRNQKYGEHTVNFDAVSARYVKFQGVKRAMNYGYSMWEFKVIAK